MSLSVEFAEASQSKFCLGAEFLSVEASQQLRFETFPFFPATPKKGMASMAVSSPAIPGSDLDLSDNRGGFRTPNLAVRRPSFKNKAAAFLGVSKK